MATLTRWKIWMKMVVGKSELHLDQPIGGFIDAHKLYGYYNNMSNKVTFDKKTEQIVEYIPIFKNDYGKNVIFPIQIIQYALGCYELFLMTKKDIYLEKMLYCSEYVLNLINDDGSISCMYFVEGLNNPYSSMCQGECISLLARAYAETNEEKYFKGAMKAYSFLTDLNHPMAVAKSYENHEYCLFEYPEKGIVLNGYIYSLFGIYDAYLLTSNPQIKKIFDISLDSLFAIIDRFNYGEWSYYDLDKNIASKFYHKCHIDLMRALKTISDDRCDSYIKNWSSGLKNKKLCRKMFWKKASQKLFRKKGKKQ